MILALDVNEKSKKRIETPKLNKIIEHIQKSHALPVLGGYLKIFYATQTDTVPPQFKFFVNNPSLFRKDMIRFFQKFLQKEMDIKGVPVIIHIEGRKKKERTK
jgi:GTP-binding protein